MNHAKVKLFRTKRLRIKSLDDASIPINADGEMSGMLPIEVECVPKAVRIVIPDRT